jgi:hypothetical protein
MRQMSLRMILRPIKILRTVENKEENVQKRKGIFEVQSKSVMMRMILMLVSALPMSSMNWLGR